MPGPDSKSSPFKDDRRDLRERTLRSSSPAVKRPASDMGGQEREDDNKDVEMADDHDGSSPNTQTMNGKRQKSDSTLLNASNPNPVSQMAPSEDSSISDSTLPDASRASTTATSIMDSNEAFTQPSIDEQIARITKLVMEHPKDGDKGYCVSGKWLIRVQARGSDAPKGMEKSALEGEVGPVDNSDIAMVAEDSGTLRDEAGELFTFLRPGLAIGEEMQVLPQEAWTLVTQWYGVAAESPIITRYAHALSEDNPQEVQYELYPPVFTFLKVVGTQTLQTQKEAATLPPRIVSSVHRPYMTWLKEAKEKLNINMATKVRVWKILGGLKSTSASGILTPAASRSASPAPGAEIIASAGSKMIIDVNTFSLLALGDQRDLIDHKDQTMDAKYNGKIDLRTIGLGRSDVIVLEEQTSESDKFPSDSPKFSIRGSAKAKNLTVNGRASPTPSMTTRGRAQRDGRPKGIVGLQNLGNTCYMNSALQCIRSVAELTEYFRSGYYKKELNYDNPLGHRGEIAKAYGWFIDGVYSTTGNAFNPTTLKKVVGKYGPSFAGYGQQDSQEFLAFLLDGLQEDLNRITKKPYIEKPDSTDDMVNNTQLLKEFADRNWNDYKARNDSVVTDLFAGMYKSTLTCPACDKVSIVFDPYSTLTLQLPIENNWAKEIIYFPLRQKPFRIDVDIDKNATIEDMKNFIADRVRYDPQLMICAESYKNKFFKVFDNNEVIAEASINTNDVVCMYELPVRPTNYNADKKKKYSAFTSYTSKDTDPKVDSDDPAADQLLTPLYHRVQKPNGNNRLIRSYFGHPSYVVLSRNDRRSYDGVLKQVLTQVAGMTTLDIMSRDLDDVTPEDSDTLVISGSSGSQSPSASGNSVQGEDGIVDVSMREAGQASADQPKTKEAAWQHLMQQGTPVPHRFQHLFEIKVVHTDDGIPTGWNNFNENTEYESLREKAAQLSKSLAHHPRRSIDEENYDGSSTDELAHDEPDGRRNSAGSGSESGTSPRQASDGEDDDLPSLNDLTQKKDTRGISKFQKRRVYSRKGKKIIGKSTRRTPPPPPPQPKVSITDTQELVVPGDAIILDWDLKSCEALFEGDASDTMRGSLTHDDIEVFEDEELSSKRAARLARKKNGVTLEDCLHEFGKTETLSEQNAWYCPRCKEHRRADKQFELWKVPDVLVMHLKRFSSARNFRDKLELKVEYPVENLDLSDMVRDQSDGKSLIYDLIAVDNHYGGLGGGHYTAYAKNNFNGNWYDYNDSHVSQVKDPESVVQRNAYLLFYRRRTEGSLGGPNLEQLLTEVDSESNANSRDVSPSGEGQRLGDSSHNGSSSALVGQARHVGDGGSAVNQQSQKTSGLSRHQEGEQGGHLIYRGASNSDAQLPDYADHEDDEMLFRNPVDEGVAMGADQSVYETPWTTSTWNFSLTAHHSSEVDETELPYTDFIGPLRRNSNVSAAAASSTGAFGGSDTAVSDLDETADSDPEAQSMLRRNRESAPPPEDDTGLLPQVIQIPLGAGDEEEELEVKELRIDSDAPVRSS